MKIHLIKRQSIENYASSNIQSKEAFGNWLSVIKYAEWKKPQDMIITFNSADILGKSSSRVVFNIGGNKYRIICKYFFGENKVHLFVTWIGTHAEYTKLCGEGKQYTINQF